MRKSLLYFVLLYYSHKSWTIFKTRVSFEICRSWRFQNTPYMCNLTKFWLRYLMLKTHGTILLFSWLWIWLRENYWDLNIFGKKQLIKHPRPFDGISKDYSCWYWYLWWWTEQFLEQIVQINVISISNKSIIKKIKQDLMVYWIRRWKMIDI